MPQKQRFELSAQQPPESRAGHPELTATTHLLPFDRLSPQDFERLCLALVIAEGYEDVRHVGAAGGDSGRDITARLGPQRWLFQAKRTSRFGFTAVKAELIKIRASPYAAETIVFTTSCNVSAKTRDQTHAYLSTYGVPVACEFWPATELDARLRQHPDLIQQFFQIARENPPALQRVSLGRLPSTGRYFLGRSDVLEMLDSALSNPVQGVFCIVAAGGVGKTALVNHWLHQLAGAGYSGARNVFGWSFYSQGANERIASSADFFNVALGWFGDPDPGKGTLWQKTIRLVELIRKAPTLLILDGVEPLQNPPGRDEGRLRDPALRWLIRDLAAACSGLCVITTRYPVADLQDLIGTGAGELRLKPLSPADGAELLAARGVTGTPAQLRAAAGEFGGHPLALSLLAGYLVDAFDGDVRQRHLIGNLLADSQQGGHAERVMQAYERWLAGTPEIAALRVLGLFQTPAEEAALQKLRSEPLVASLNDQISSLDETSWRRTIAHLERAMLVTYSDELQAFETHPLVGDYFGRSFCAAAEPAFREGHRRLFEYFSQAAVECPSSLEEMAPLFAAVRHGCVAGSYRESIEIVMRRMFRGEDSFVLRKLGALDSILIILAGFFDAPWKKTVDALTPLEQGFVLAEAGYCLRSLLRFPEAREALVTALEFRRGRCEWEEASYAACNLSEIALALGSIEIAIRTAREGIIFARRGAVPKIELFNMTALADAYHQAGNVKAAQRLFLKAENLQRRVLSRFSILYSLRGFQYCELLLEKGDWRQVSERSRRVRRWARKRPLGLLSLALNKLSLGQAYASAARAGAGSRARALRWVDEAVFDLRVAGTLDLLPKGLLTRAGLWRVPHDEELAERDIVEALELARMGGLRLVELDCRRALAWLRLRSGRFAEALEGARALARDTGRIGYRRHNKDIEELISLAVASSGALN